MEPRSSFAGTLFVLKEENGKNRQQNRGGRNYQNLKRNGRDEGKKLIEWGKHMNFYLQLCG